MSIRRTKPLFSLADQLFNEETVGQLALRVARSHKRFDPSAFTDEVLAAFPTLALKARIDFMVDALTDHLPGKFEQAVGILRRALPPPLDPEKGDDDFGQFIWVVPGEYVARHGCTVEHLETSLTFLRESTMRFSAESAIRPFLANFQTETLAFIQDCASHEHYHVRRLASEGIRPYLPWARKVVLPPGDIIKVLDKLYADNTRYVTRSVSNTLNDLSRDDPELVIRTLRRWHTDNRQGRIEIDWMTSHALRTLLKAGHANALELLGYPSAPAFALTGTRAGRQVQVGESLVYEACLVSRKKQKLKVSLRVYFRRADGTHHRKVFAIKDVSMEQGERLDVRKNVSFKPISTRTLYPGTHHVELIVNGVARGKRSFQLLA